MVMPKYVSSYFTGIPSFEGVTQSLTAEFTFINVKITLIDMGIWLASFRKSVVSSASWLILIYLPDLEIA